MNQMLSPRSFQSQIQQNDNGLHYLLIINKDNEPLFFKSYQTSTDELNIQLHCYASLDFLDEKWTEKSNEYLGSVYTIYNLSGKSLYIKGNMGFLHFTQ